MMREHRIALILCTVVYCLGHWYVASRQWPLWGLQQAAALELLMAALMLSSWIGSMLVLHFLGFRGDWTFVVVPFLWFSVARPLHFELLTDMVMTSRGTDARAESPKRVGFNEALRWNRVALLATDSIALPSGELRRDVSDSLLAEATERLRRWPTVSSRGVLSRGIGMMTPWCFVLMYAFRPNRNIARMIAWWNASSVRPLAVCLALAASVLAARALERTGALRGFSVSLLVIPSIPIVICTAVGSRAADYGDRFSSLRANALLVMMLAAGLVAFGAFPLGDVRTVTDYGTAMLVLAAVLAGTLAVRLPRHVAALWSATVIGALAVVLITSTRPRERLTLLVQTHLAIADRDAAFSNERRDANALPTEQAVAVARALLSGGWSGVGSSSIPLWVIPRASDDLIFSALVHRGGLIGMLALLGSLWVFFEAVRRLASATVVSEDRAVVWATASLILLPLAYGALVALGVMPISGVAFPFWAMSSSSGIASALLVGTLLAFSEDHQE